MLVKNLQFDKYVSLRGSSLVGLYFSDIHIAVLKLFCLEFLIIRTELC